MWIYLWAFSSVPLIYISVFVPVPYCLDDCGFVVESEVSRLIPPVPFFFLKIALVIRGFLYFHTNCEIICSSSVKNTVGSLIGIALNLHNKSYIWQTHSKHYPQWWKSESISPEIRNKARVPTLTTTIQHSVGSVGHSNQGRRRSKRNPDRKRRSETRCLQMTWSST